MVSAHISEHTGQEQTSIRKGSWANGCETKQKPCPSRNSYLVLDSLKIQNLAADWTLKVAFKLFVTLGGVFLGEAPRRPWFGDGGPSSALSLRVRPLLWGIQSRGLKCPPARWATTVGSHGSLATMSLAAPVHGTVWLVSKRLMNPAKLTPEVLLKNQERICIFFSYGEIIKLICLLLKYIEDYLGRLKSLSFF